MKTRVGSLLHIAQSINYQFSPPDEECPLPLGGPEVATDGLMEALPRPGLLHCNSKRQVVPLLVQLK